MPRTIDFDYDRALEQATAVFWRHGYAGTSVRDLLKAMGIGEGSFYNTLGSKKALYVRCLELYAETEGRRRIFALTSAPTAAEGVRAMFAALLARLDDPATPSRLCMQSATAAAEVLAEPDLRARVETSLTRFHGVLAAQLLRDRSNGLLRDTLDVETTASVLMTYSQGLWRMALVDYDRPRFERQIDVLVSALGL